MDKDTAISNSAFCCSVSLLRLLLHMKLISAEEYEKIVQISAAYYEPDIYCV